MRGIAGEGKNEDADDSGFAAERRALHAEAAELGTGLRHNPEKLHAAEAGGCRRGQLPRPGEVPVLDSLPEPQGGLRRATCGVAPDLAGRHQLWRSPVQGG